MNEYKKVDFLKPVDVFGQDSIGYVAGMFWVYPREKRSEKDYFR